MTARTSPVTLTPLLGLPEVREGDDIADLVLKALQHNGIQLIDGDILVVSSKVVSKAMGLRAPAGEQADVVLSQTVRIVAERMTPSGVTRIVESAAGPVMTAAGVDASNTADESIVLILPDDPDAVAAQIRDGVQTGWAGAFRQRCPDGSHPQRHRRPALAHRSDRLCAGSRGHPGHRRPARVDRRRRAGPLGHRAVHRRRDRRRRRPGQGQGDRHTGSPRPRPWSVRHTTATTSKQRRPKRRQKTETNRGARDLVRTGPQDWFGYGMVEAVRAALGVEPGSATASEVGIPFITREDAATRAGRALRVALLTCPDAVAQVDGDTISLVAPDDFTLGVAATRAEVALRGEGLTTTLTRYLPAPTDSSAPTLSAAELLTSQPHVLIVFQ